MTTKSPSRAYVDMICKFLHNNRQQGLYWRKFSRLAWEFPVAKLAVQESLELQKKFDFQPRQCYLNAARLVIENPFSFDYVEGVATCTITTEHAWVVDKTWGWVIDPTWIGLHTRARKPEHKIQDYCGVRIRIDLVRQQLREREVYGPLLPGCIQKLKPRPKTRPLTEPE